MLLAPGVLSPQGLPETDTSAAIKPLFSDPPAEYCSAPLWVWNDRLTDDMIRGTLRDLAAQKVKQAFVHPRPGLMTPYLSPEWFRLWKVALDEAERLDMKLWIYDENSYPSGFAGGLVPEAMPESRGRGLIFRDESFPPGWTPESLGVFRLTDAGYEDVTEKVRTGASLPEARYVAASVARAKPGPWYGGKFYVDLLYPGVTEKFLSITLDSYRREIGHHFGKRVPGVFTDEPELRPAGGLPWTTGLPQLFEKRWGYSLSSRLPALRDPFGDWKRVRHNYYQVLLEQFVERWGRPYYEYCEKNGLEFTGHYWEHEWPNCTSVPDNMAMSAWQQRPGIDTLMNQYREDTHAQFGNVRAVKEVSSIANQLGRARTLCEAYGAGGWDLRFEDMKRIGDWLYVLGINTLDQHLSYVSIRGARKRDHPQSFSYHEPWWGSYHASAAYFARLSVALSAGRQMNQVLVLEPTTTAWMYNAPGKTLPELDKLGELFQNLLLALEKAQVEYDLGCEDIMARHGSVEGAALRVGQGSYTTVVLPPMTENLNSKTLSLLEDFLRAGGSLLSCGPPPNRLDGATSERGLAIARLPGWRQVDAGRLDLAQADFAVQRASGDKGILFHHRRRIGDGHVLFLVNTSLEYGSSGSVETRGGGVERWLPETGAGEAYPFENSRNGVRCRFELPPAGSLLLFIANKARTPAPAGARKTVSLEPSGQLAVRRAAPNVLVLDYLDVRAGGDSRTDTYFYQGSQFAFKQNGVPRNPWDSSVQFRDELISMKFPATSGVRATYRFNIRDRVPMALFAVVERADLYTVACNGRPVKAVEGSWWLDRSFQKIDISAAARVGSNELTLGASPFSVYHELEPVYLLGEFSLVPAERGFAIAPAQPLNLGPWNSQGHPFYSEGVEYTRKYHVEKPAGEYLVTLNKWYGSVARVSVNGKHAGVIYSSPWSLDVTPWVSMGVNTIEVTVIGTLKNTLGPHHGNPELGTAWPAMFQKGISPGPPPGREYSTVAYGLYEPFILSVLK
jgi:hypothetical protein